MAPLPDTLSGDDRAPRIGRGFRLQWEPAQSAQSVQAPPLGAAPLSFADLVQTVSPAVVSINVKGESEVADNDMQIPGLPDLPEDNPLYDFFKQFRQAQKPRWAPGSSASDHSPRLGLLHFT